MEAIDKKKCGITGKQVAVYTLVVKARSMQMEPAQGRLELWRG